MVRRFEAVSFRMRLVLAWRAGARQDLDLDGLAKAAWKAAARALDALALWI